MSKASIWEIATPETDFPALKTNLTVDAVVIGGGITGITAAYNLSRAGMRVAVLEAYKIGEGDTGSSTGNLYCTIGNPGLHTVASKFSEDKAKEVAESRAAAINFIEDRITEYAVDCDFKRVPWSLFTEGSEGKNYIEKEKEAAQKAGIPITTDIPFPLRATGFTVPNQAQFNPLKYVKALAERIQSDRCMIFENSRAVKIEEGDSCTVETSRGTVTAQYIVMATHTPLGIYFVHTSLGPYREYAVAVKLKGEYPAPGIFWDMPGSEHYSMRVYDSPNGKVLMALGEMHKTGQKKNNGECFDNLEKFLRERFDVASVEYKWSAQQFKAADGIPYIGLSTGNKKTYIATGFSADGLTYGTLAGMIIADQIVGKENPWAKTYDASRLTPIASAGKFLKENLNVAAELIKDTLKKADATHFADLKPGEGKITEIDGQKCAASRGADGELFAVSAICTHMGCTVHWNKAETTWDCPCHGSRFTQEGEVIEGPAIAPLQNINTRAEHESEGGQPPKR